MREMVRVPTPNFGITTGGVERKIGSRLGKPIRLIVLHADGSPDERATRQWIQNPASQVSYHVEIERDGTLVRYVEDEERAWAVGVATWNGITDVNTISLSASFANRNDQHLPELLTPVQRDTMRELVAFWRARFPSIEAITTHAAVARPAGRKTDPLFAPNFSLKDFAWTGARF